VSKFLEKVKTHLLELWTGLESMIRTSFAQGF
jgi:hypothetical protein